jgi:hypothetical protein
MHQGPFSASEFSVTNFWQGPVAGQWLLVYAGGSPSTDGAIATGGLRIYSEPVDPNTGSEPTFIGQYSDGSSGLSIISATGRDLKLRSDQGDSLSFDLVAKTFGAAG